MLLLQFLVRGSLRTLLLRRVLGLARDLIFLLCQLTELRQLLKLAFVLLNRLLKFLQLFDRLLCCSARLIQFLLATFRGVLQRGIFQALPRFCDLLRRFAHLVRLVSLHPALHALGQICQILLRVRQLLTRFFKRLLCLFRKLLLLNLVLVLLHARLRLAHILNRLVQRLAHITLLRPDLLPHNRFRIAIDPDRQPLRVAHAGSSQRFRKHVGHCDAHPQLLGVLPPVEHLADRHDLLATPERLGAQVILFRQVAGQRFHLASVHLEFHLGGLYSHIFLHFVLKANQLIRPHPHLLLRRSDEGDHRRLVQLHLHRETDAFDLALQAMSQHHLAQSVLFRDESPIEFHPAAPGIRIHRHGADLLAIHQEAPVFHRGVGHPLQLHARPRQGHNPLTDGTALRGAVGVFRKGIEHLEIIHPRQRPHRDVIAIALRLSDPGVVVKAVPCRRETVVKLAHSVRDPRHRDALGKGLHSIPLHHQGELLGLGVGKLDRNPDFVAFQHLDVLRSNRKAHRARIAEIREGRERAHKEPLRFPREDHKEKKEDRGQSRRRPHPPLGPPGADFDPGIDILHVPLRLEDQFLQQGLRHPSARTLRQFESGAHPFLNLRVPRFEPARHLHKRDPIAQWFDQPGPDSPQGAEHQGPEHHPAHDHRQGREEEIRRHGEEQASQHKGHQFCQTA